MIKLTYELERSGDCRRQLQEEAMTRSAPHNLAGKNNKAEIVLTAEDLDRVVGGGKTHSTQKPPTEFLTITMSDIIVSRF